MSAKLIMATMAVAVMASPVMAETVRHAHGHATPATATTDEAHGSTASTHHGRLAPAASATPVVEDCTHVAFPQCSGGN
jgi:hypothetical protein